MHFLNSSQPEPAGFQRTAIPGNATALQDVNAATVLNFLRGASGTADCSWLMPVIHFARQVPAFSGNILEVHLGKADNNVDFAPRLHAGFDKALIPGVKESFYQMPLVNSNLSKLIHQEGNGFIQGIQNIWVEFDAPFTKAPALFFDINREAAFDPQAAFDCLQQVAAMLGVELSTALLPFLQQLKKAELHVLYYGFMFSRNSRSVRLTINGIETKRLAAALSRLGWKGNYLALEKLTKTYLKKGQKLVVGVDIGTNTENRIGIEVSGGDHTILLRALYCNHQISKAHYDLLSIWERSYTLPHDLCSALTGLHQRPVSRLYTRINHFKFVADATEKVEVKAYLYYCF